ncbi:hypothetical protein GQ55_2G460100 [Panicum hallii var. hallii]|uniref:Uncharacterized protein n=1 Tax=Panicum hallii var. hallii TaxID=1504633 RepID=A0A2T7EZL0_9POAL|nr:hypothetical protein GQ55_2G460100 [Panicum hallii var. hallii]
MIHSCVSGGWMDGSSCDGHETIQSPCPASTNLFRLSLTDGFREFRTHPPSHQPLLPTHIVKKKIEMFVLACIVYPL